MLIVFLIKIIIIIVVITTIIIISVWVDGLEKTRQVCGLKKKNWWAFFGHGLSTPHLGSCRGPYWASIKKKLGMARPAHLVGRVIFVHEF